MQNLDLVTRPRLLYLDEFILTLSKKAFRR